jgi:enhancing lycopene biosynthesis protein 2
MYFDNFRLKYVYLRNDCLQKNRNMSTSKKTAIVLSGCGVFDGAEIHEATFTMYAVMKLGGTYDVYAPDIAQYHVINHLSGDVVPETRNVLVESARISRGKIQNISNLDMRYYDALMFPGGFGVAKNLSNLAFRGADCSVNSDVERVIRQAVTLKKPIGALCISPAMVSRVVTGAEVTVGQDEYTAQQITKMGGKHTNTNHGEVVIDKKFKLATTPCYMLEANILNIADGAMNVTEAVFSMIE